MIAAASIELILNLLTAKAPIEPIAHHSPAHSEPELALHAVVPALLRAVCWYDP
jgi:hypothetical protein